ncbi:MAG: hypothetical protein QW470_02015 [Candidatus Caldarchaeum sp.]
MRMRTPFPAVLYGLYLVALGLSFRCVSRAVKPFVGRSHVAKWVQRLPGFRRVFRASAGYPYPLRMRLLPWKASWHGSGLPTSLTAKEP